jgi:enamine deaminase RidA (YjgF/YER057c/UK114 family)
MAGHIRFSNPKTLAPPPGYSYVVETSGKRMRTVYFAGQLGLDLNNRLVGAAGDFRAQCVQAFGNMALALKAAGAGWGDVVKINNYCVDIEKTIGIFREVRDQYLNTKAPPASTTVGVPALARPGALFEIEAIVVMGRGKAAKPAKSDAGAKKEGKKENKKKGKEKNKTGKS